MIRGSVNRLEIRGFRRFQKSTEFLFADSAGKSLKTIVIAGPNGAGKSTIFEAILYVLGRDNLVQQQISNEHRTRWFKSALARDVNVTVTVDVMSATGTTLGTLAPTRIRISRSESEWEIVASDDSQLIARGEKEVRSILTQLAICWFSSWRQPYLPGPIKPMSEIQGHIGSESSRIWRLKIKLINDRAKTAFHEINQQLVAERGEEWLSRLNKAWTGLRGDDGTFLALGMDKSREDASEADIFLKRVDSDFGEIIVCSVDHLSSGELEWLAIAGTLITNDFDGIVLIDEPELHLHPEWQARLIPALRIAVPDSQIIIASHADAPWDQAYSFERILLVPDEDPRFRERNE